MSTGSATIPPYTLVRSRRKTAAIYITKDAAVEVRAPLQMPKPEIDRLVASKEAWIAAHLATRERLNAEKAAFSVNYGDTAVLLGKLYPICPRDGNRAGYNGECFFLPPGLPANDVKAAVIRIYKAVAKSFLTARTAEYAKRMGVVPTAVKINSAKTRWGSCSGKNSVNFSWRLMMADEDVVDYVVVHELAHIREHNHSARFWAVVENMLPDYKARQRNLKLLQKRLSTQDWDLG